MLIQLFESLNKQFPPRKDTGHYLFYDSILQTLMLGMWKDEGYTYYGVTEDENFKDFQPLIELFKTLDQKYPHSAKTGSYLGYYDNAHKLFLVCAGNTGRDIVEIAEEELQDMQKLVNRIDAKMEGWSIDPSHVSQTIN